MQTQQKHSLGATRLSQNISKSALAFSEGLRNVVVWMFHYEGEDTERSGLPVDSLLLFYTAGSFVSLPEHTACQKQGYLFSKNHAIHTVLW